MELVIQNVSKSYAERQIFNKLSLKFEVGVNYLIAPNGTGKSTLLKLISGIEKQDGGNIMFNGKALKFPDYGSYVPDKMTMYPFITGQEFLDLVAAAKKIANNKECFIGMIADLNIAQYLTTPFANMSLGTQKKFFIIAGLAGDFSCLLMDEPTNAVDKQSLDIIIGYLKKLADTKLIIIATHDQHLQAQLAGKIVRLDVDI